MAVSEQVTQVEKDWREAPLKSLIERLVRDHRSWRAKDFPLIEHLFDRIEDAAASVQPSGLLSLRRAFYRLRAEWTTHEPGRTCSVSSNCGCGESRYHRIGRS